MRRRPAFEAESHFVNLMTWMASAVVLAFVPAQVLAQHQHMPGTTMPAGKGKAKPNPEKSPKEAEPSKAATRRRG